MRFRGVSIGGVNRAAAVHAYVGGKAVNVARAVGTLGEALLCLGVRGGMLGEHLWALLERDGITSAFLEVQATTRVCITVVDDAAKHATELIEDAPPMTEVEGRSLIMALENHLSGAAALVMSGSLARGLASDYYARCIRMARERGVLTILDTSGAPLRDAIDAKPDLIKINSHELAGLSGADDVASEVDLLERARQLASTTSGRVIITRGGESTIAMDVNGTALRVEPVRVEPVVSPIGCGDSFAAGLAVGLVRRQRFDEALALGTACALANLQTPDAAHFELAAVERWKTSVVVRSV